MLVLPLALLHDPLFSLETPRYLGLGTLGFIVAHEIMHGFDNSGILTQLFHGNDYRLISNLIIKVSISTTTAGGSLY